MLIVLSRKWHKAQFQLPIILNMLIINHSLYLPTDTETIFGILKKLVTLVASDRENLSH